MKQEPVNQLIPVAKLEDVQERPPVDPEIIERVARAIEAAGPAPYDATTDDLTIPLAFRLVYAERQRDALVKGLRTAVKVAERARQEWDAAPSGMKAGKLLIALAGGSPNYISDTDFIHALLREAEATNAQ